MAITGPTIQFPAMIRPTDLTRIISQVRQASSKMSIGGQVKPTGIATRGIDNYAKSIQRVIPWTERLNATNIMGFQVFNNNAEAVSALRLKFDYLRTSMGATSIAQSLLLSRFGMMLIIFGSIKMVTDSMTKSLKAYNSVQLATMRVLTVTDSSREESVKNMQLTAIATKDTIEDLHRSSFYKLEDIQNAYYRLSSAGFKSGEAQRELADTMKFLSINEGETKTATEALARTYNVFRDEVSGIIDVADRFQVTIANSQIDMDQLSATLLKSAGAAKSAGLGLSEYLAVISVASKRGEPGRRLGTGITAFLRDTQKHASELKKIGIEVYDSQDSYRGIIPILKDLNKELGNTTDKQKTINAVNEIFGEQAKRFYQYAIQGADELDGKLKQISESTGEVSDKHEKLADLLQKQWEQLGNVWESTGRSLVEAFLPAIQFAMIYVVDFTDKMNKLSKVMNTFTQSSVLLYNTITTYIDGWKSLGDVYDEIIVQLTKIKAIWGKVRDPVGGVGETIKEMVVDVENLGQSTGSMNTKLKEQVDLYLQMLNSQKSMLSYTRSGFEIGFTTKQSMRSITNYEAYTRQISSINHKVINEEARLRKEKILDIEFYNKAVKTPGVEKEELENTAKKLREAWTGNVGVLSEETQKQLKLSTDITRFQIKQSLEETKRSVGDFYDKFGNFVANKIKSTKIHEISKAVTLDAMTPVFHGLEAIHLKARENFDSNIGKIKVAMAGLDGNIASTKLQVSLLDNEFKKQIKTLQEEHGVLGRLEKEYGKLQERIKEGGIKLTYDKIIESAFKYDQVPLADIEKYTRQVENLKVEALARGDQNEAEYLDRFISYLNARREAEVNLTTQSISLQQQYTQQLTDLYANLQNSLASNLNEIGNTIQIFTNNSRNWAFTLSETADKIGNFANAFRKFDEIKKTQQLIKDMSGTLVQVGNLASEEAINISNSINTLKGTIGTFQTAIGIFGVIGAGASLIGTVIGWLKDEKPEEKPQKLEEEDMQSKLKDILSDYGKAKTIYNHIEVINQIDLIDIDSMSEELLDRLAEEMKQRLGDLSYQET